ncbi:M28 family metallopeptidase [Pseudomarimonas arenosa]|uniref:M28 family peptidase n=1 Tax=Pseudomarimonas arenosa TaxID=2774145 RepID=A0AAW3ZQC8_9GAMM|nr:M28 family metallopeptidase [Pseudomarimonas arenosa]MBD8527933.1 M28 family peptidase [Pseudomarimonas arenosa]
MRIVFALAAVVLAGCQPSTPPPASGSADAQQAAPAGPLSSHVSGPEISGEDFAEHVRMLSSDEFAGRAPGTIGEQKTVAYLEDQFKRLGLKPGNGDSFRQTVPMVASKVAPDTTLTLHFEDGDEVLKFGSEMVLGSSTGQAEIKLDHSEMVFLGYGVSAPEADWNDYSVDVKGKTVVLLVNDPGFHVGDESLFQGRRMTYYGRWSYKYEEAARQGAAAALIIHDDAGAGYGWDVVQNSWSGEQYDLPYEQGDAPRLPVQGWLTGEQADKLFKRVGLSLPELRQAANQRDFKPVALNVAASTVLNSEIHRASSDNVMALLPGSERPEELIVYMGHWDHLGTNPDLQGDQIYNGAIDNATGIAGILEIAERFVTQSEPPKRSVLFLAVTLEESGLLGSKFYAANPIFPLNQTVAAINLDAMHLPGPTRDLVVIGLGNSELEDILRPIADAQGRTLRPEAGLEKGFFYRSDHFSFAKAGVPALYAKSGVDHIEGGKERGEAWGAGYTAERYHKPADEFDPNWELAGVVQDLSALYQVGAQLAAGEQWPNWYAGNEFRAIRDAARGEAAVANAD